MKKIKSKNEKLTQMVMDGYEELTKEDANNQDEKSRQQQTNKKHDEQTQSKQQEKSGENKDDEDYYELADMNLEEIAKKLKMGKNVQVKIITMDGRSKMRFKEYENDENKLDELLTSLLTHQRDGERRVHKLKSNYESAYDSESSLDELVRAQQIEQSRQQERVGDRNSNQFSDIFFSMIDELRGGQQPSEEEDQSESSARPSILAGSSGSRSENNEQDNDDDDETRILF